jgi:23S rRNA (cytosine1962-C5)-methyltransferase
MIDKDERKLIILTSPDWKDYALLDSGNNRRLEKFGDYTLIRPDKQAIWHPGLDDNEWRSANAEFLPGGGEKGGSWRFQNQVPQTWSIKYKDLEFWAHLSESKNLGVFPEQATHWDWLRKQIRRSYRSVNILNLFGYTGLASLAAASVGAQVTHVDASKYSITLARNNQMKCGLADRPIRWIVDDALKFVKRESRRGKKYDGIIMDPPKFGRGPKGEIWDVTKMLTKLLEECSKILSDSPIFFLITVYSVPISAITLQNLIKEIIQDNKYSVDVGEMGIVEESKGRVLSTAVFARWSFLEDK